MINFLLIPLLSVLVVSQSRPVLALEQERITTFDSQIVINQDTSLTVTENIRVYASGNEIKRGIYRDFPTKYKDSKGLNYNTTFEVLEVLKDGMKEDHHTEKLSNGTRLYIGNSSVYLDPGFYLYTIKYTTNGQLGFFKDHDELYYNVTGNGWVFSIEKATATVQLPDGVSPDRIKIEAYTGSTGSKDINYFGSVYSADGKTYTYFETTSQLYSNQGLTVVAGWPKGFVNEPTLWQKLVTFMMSNLKPVIGVELLILILLYYLIAWLKHGRDPEGAGTIVPQFDIIKGVSPAGVRYIHKMEFDHKALTVSLVSMAIKGYIKINEDGGEFSIELVGKNRERLTEEEKILDEGFLSNGSKSFTFKKSKATKISSVIEKFKKSLEEIYLNKFFKNNYAFLTIPLLLTLLYLAVVFIPSAGGLFSFILLALMVVANIIGGIAMKARTALGRGVEDRILGLKEYFTAVEKPRYASNINLETPDSLKVYEKYLPYAIALDVEPVWTGRFKDQINAAQMTDEDGKYNTYWYHGSSFYAGSVFANSLGSAITGAISSSSTPPGSSSGFSGGGGGGGSSGGGGGGGGGGGW